MENNNNFENLEVNPSINNNEITAFDAINQAEELNVLNSASEVTPIMNLDNTSNLNVNLDINQPSSSVDTLNIETLDNVNNFGDSLDVNSLNQVYQNVGYNQAIVNEQPQFEQPQVINPQVEDLIINIETPVNNQPIDIASSVNNSVSDTLNSIYPQVENESIIDNNIEVAPTPVASENINNIQVTDGETNTVNTQSVNPTYEQPVVSPVDNVMNAQVNQVTQPREVNEKKKGVSMPIIVLAVSVVILCIVIGYLVVNYVIK